MSSVISAIEAKFRKHDVVNVKSGDSVRVHQKIKEGNKERIQVFEGLVIRTDRKNSHTSSITVRRLTGGIGVEKTYLVHSPLVEKIEVTKRSKVRRNYLTYMRQRTGKAARLSGVDFDKEAVNAVKEAPEPKVEEPKSKEADSDKISEIKETKEEVKESKTTEKDHAESSKEQK